MLSVEEARRLLLDVAPAPVAEQVELWEAAGRVLARDVTAGEDVPAFDRSVMDGYAVRAADVAGATPQAPALLRLLGAAAAGHATAASLLSGTAVAISTGAPLPAGADTVVRLEEAREAGDTVAVLLPASAGANVGWRGGDLRAGDLALRRGTCLGPAQVGVLAALGWTTVPVWRRPRVAILPTGDELVGVGATPGPGQVRNSTAYALGAAVRAAGGAPHLEPPLPDRLEAIAGAVAEAARAGAGLVLTTGGASVGHHDHIREALALAGGEVLFWRVAIKPGKNIAAARRGNALLVGLSGNPAAALVTFELVVRPALAAMAGLGPGDLAEVAVILDHALPRRPALVRYLRAEVCRDRADGRLHGRLAGSQEAGVLGSMARANALLVVEPGQGTVPAGEAVRAVILPGAEAGLLAGEGLR